MLRVTLRVNAWYPSLVHIYFLVVINHLAPQSIVRDQVIVGAINHSDIYIDVRVVYRILAYVITTGSVPCLGVRRCPGGYSYSTSSRDNNGFDSPIGIGVGRGHVLATATGLKSLPPELRETPLNTGGREGVMY